MEYVMLLLARLLWIVKQFEKEGVGAVEKKRRFEVSESLPLIVLKSVILLQSLT